MLLRKLLRRSIVCISNEFEYLFIINEKGTPKLVFLFLEVAEREESLAEGDVPHLFVV